MNLSGYGPAIGTREGTGRMEEIEVPKVDVCAFCSDVECDGIGCIARLDPDNPDDHPKIDELHGLIRAGIAFAAAHQILTEADSVFDTCSLSAVQMFRRENAERNRT